jgi:hypothetical protein
VTRNLVLVLVLVLGRTASADEQLSAPAPLRALHHRFLFELELFTDADWVARDGSDLSQIRLDRGEVGATVGLGPQAGAELRLETVRSAAEGGVLGIDGDSLVVRIKRAQVFGHYDVGDVHLVGALGFTPDAWIASLEQDYTLRPLSPTASERLLDWAPSDLALFAAAELGPARLSVTFGNGEGLRYPERNTGKTTTAVLEVDPYVDGTTRVRLLAMGKDGSLGPASVRDQRVGGGATFASDPASAGVELVRAYGIAEVGTADGTVVGGWAEVRPILHTAVAARAATIGYDGGGRHSSFGGAVAVEPWHEHDRARLRLWLALDHTTATGGAMPLAGADPGTATTLFLIASTTAPFAID